MQKQFQILLSISFVLFFYSCSVNKAKIDNELKQFYSETSETEGCFSMLDNSTGEITVYNMSLDTTRFSPASTFIIPLSLISLQTGAVTDEKMVIPINSSDSANSNVPKQLNIVDAFKQNSFPFFYNVSNKIRHDTLSAWIDRLSYGNKASGKNLDSFWMNNILKISPDEQLGLLKHLYFDQLPFRKSVHLLVREMMVKEDNSAYKLSYCSSTNKDEKNNIIFWCMGWVEENRHVYFFVNLEKSSGNNVMKKDSMGASRKILEHFGFFKGKK
jgi:beta-lactamase class D